LIKSTTKYRKYNKMGMDGGVDVADGDRDDAKASMDPSSCEDR
jgi:hypothetical protein